MRRAATLASLGIAAVLAACSVGGATGAAPDGTASAADAGLSGELVVAAAASLTEAFTDLGAAFEDEHPDLDVTFAFAASSTLASQIVAGAPIDVFASANRRQVEVVTAEGLAGEPITFATNALELVVEAGNPLGIEELADLERDDLVLVLAAPEVPAGELAARMLDEAGIRATPSSLELDVRATLGRVELGEADVAIVYRSDVTTAGDAVEGIAIDAAVDLATDYPIVAIDDGANPAAAAAWIEFVTGPQGREALERAGLSVP